MSDKKIKEEYIRVLSKIKLNEEKKEELMKITDDKKVSDKNKNFRLKYVLGLAVLVMVFYGGYKFISQFGKKNVSIAAFFRISKSSSTRARARPARNDRRFASCSSRSMASARAAGSRSATQRPVSLR